MISVGLYDLVHRGQAAVAVCSSREHEVHLSFTGEHKPVRAAVADMPARSLPLSHSQTTKLGMTDWLWGNTKVLFFRCGLRQDNRPYLERESIGKNLPFISLHFCSQPLVCISFSGLSSGFHHSCCVLLQMYVFQQFSNDIFHHFMFISALQGEM